MDGVADIDPSAPRVAFTITNTGFMPLKNVWVSIRHCGVGLQRNSPQDDVNISLGIPCNGEPLEADMHYSQWDTKELSKDEKYEIRIDASAATSNDGLFYFPPTGVKLSSVDAVMVVHFMTWVPFIHCKTAFRFVTRMERDGKLSLMPQPTDK
jgi:hypothetical protein